MFIKLFQWIKWIISFLQRLRAMLPTWQLYVWLQPKWKSTGPCRHVTLAAAPCCGTTSDWRSRRWSSRRCPCTTTSPSWPAWCRSRTTRWGSATWTGSPRGPSQNRSPSRQRIRVCDHVIWGVFVGFLGRGVFVCLFCWCWFFFFFFGFCFSCCYGCYLMFCCLFVCFVLGFLFVCFVVVGFFIAISCFVCCCFLFFVFGCFR